MLPYRGCLGQTVVKVEREVGAGCTPQKLSSDYLRALACLLLTLALTTLVLLR